MGAGVWAQGRVVPDGVRRKKPGGEVPTDSNGQPYAVEGQRFVGNEEDRTRNAKEGYAHTRAKSNVQVTVPWLTRHGISEVLLRYLLFTIPFSTPSIHCLLDLCCCQAAKLVIQAKEADRKK